LKVDTLLATLPLLLIRLHTYIHRYVSIVTEYLTSNFILLLPALHDLDEIDNVVLQVI
jgi:hypothetical protein